MGTFVYHDWGFTSIYLPLSYTIRSLDANSKMDKQTYRQMDKQTDRQLNKQTDRLTETERQPENILLITKFIFKTHFLYVCVCVCVFVCVCECV